MAKLTFYVPYNMQYFELGNPYDSYDASLTSSKVTLYWDYTYQDKSVFYGSFQISGDDVTGGTITAAEDYVDGVRQFNASGLNYSVNSYKYYATRDDGYGFLQDILKYNDSIVGSSGADVIGAFAGNDTILGGGGNDDLYGFSGNDVLNGGSGIDYMFGDGGNDAYYVDNASDRVFETTTMTGNTDSGGTDTVNSYLSAWTLGLYVENGRILSTGTASLTGNSLANTLYGGSGANTLNGLVGADVMLGGAGNDIYYVDNVGDRVYETTTTTSTTNAGGIDSVYSYLSSLTLGLYVENGRILSSGTASLTGNTLANKLEGGAGANVLNGRAGADIMLGGAGNDVYYVDNVGDRVYETTTATTTTNAGGVDTVFSYLSSWSLGLYVENGRIMSTGTANMSGNALNNVLYAGAGNNVLNGGSGTDTVSYSSGVSSTTGARVNLAVTSAQATLGSGSDTLLGIENLIGSNYNDIFTGNSLANSLSGGAGNDLLNGAAGNDRLLGGTGNDVLTGGTGRDVMTGDAGLDRFDFNSTADSGLTSSTWDVITDFVRGQDKIDLATIDANTAAAGDQAFTTIIGSTAAFTTAGQLRVSSGVLYGNTDADSAAEFAIALTGISGLSMSDVIA